MVSNIWNIKYLSVFKSINANSIKTHCNQIGEHIPQVWNCCFNAQFVIIKWININKGKVFFHFLSWTKTFSVRDANWSQNYVKRVCVPRCRWVCQEMASIIWLYDNLMLFSASLHNLRGLRSSTLSASYTAIKEMSLAGVLYRTPPCL